MQKNATHLALSYNTAKQVRQILGNMPHDQVKELLVAFDTSPTVNIEQPAPAPAPALVPKPKPEENKDEQPG